MLAAFTLVMLTGNLIKFAELVIAKGVNILDILRLLLYLIPYLFSFTIPMAALLAIVMAFGRLSSDFELIAMRASGIAPIRLIVPILTACLVLSAGVLALQNYVVPRSHLAFRRQLKVIGIKQPTAYLEAGTFLKGFPPYIIFVYEIDGQELSQVRIYEPKPNGPTRTIVANRGEFEPLPGNRGVTLTLYDGNIDEWDPERPGSLYKVVFGSYSIVLRSDAEAASQIRKKLKEMTFQELAQEQQRMDAERIETLPIELETHRRIAGSFATFVFGFFGLAMGLRTHHHERLITFVWVLGIFITYYLASAATNALALKGWLPPWLAMWWPNMLGSGLGATQLWRALRW